MSWFIPDFKLDDEQRQFLELHRSSSTNYWLQGFAGSGKSVLLVHLLIEFKRNNPNSKIAVIVYTHALVDLIKTGIPESLRSTPVITYLEFERNREEYDAAFVDEVQDLPAHVLSALARRCKRVVVAGDVNQSIYEEGCPPSAIASAVQARTFALHTIHRTSRSIRDIAKSFCSDPTAFSSAALGKNVNVQPVKVVATSDSEELQWLHKTATEYAAADYAPAILLPKHRVIYSFFDSLLVLNGKVPLSAINLDSRRDYEAINQHLISQDMPYQYLGNKHGSLAKAEGKRLITVMTFHSAKGLDFKAVFIPMLSNSLQIWRDDERLARTLFFIGLTRSREQLFLSYANNPHRYFLEMPIGAFHHKLASEDLKQKASNNSTSSIDYVF